MNHKHKTKQAGFTIIELMVVLAIVGVITIAGFVAFKSAGQSGNSAAAKVSLHDLKTCIKEVALVDGNTTNIDNDFILNSSCANKSIVNNDQLRIAGLTSEITLGQTDYSGLGGDNGLSMKFNVEQEACEKFVSAIEGEFPVVSVAGSTIKDVRADEVESSERIRAACTGVGAKSVELEFGLLG